MIRMTLTQEVDATPEQVQEALIAWRDRQAGVQFPYAPGEFCRLSVDLAERLDVHPDAPVLVLGRAEGCAHGTVAFVSKTGQVQSMAVQPAMVRALKDEPEADAA